MTRTSPGDLGLSHELTVVLGELGFHELTPIQEQALPVLLAGKDLMAQSPTGSGKTAAFGLPILERVELGRRPLQALVLCPTRELSRQVARELRRLGRRRAGLSVSVLAGGEPLRPQREALGRGVHVAVGTPGRVLDHLRRGSLELHGVRTLVLDEADRMLDMGFLDEVDEILRAAPTERQTALFSATLPQRITALSRECQRDPVFVKVEDEAEAPSVRQVVVKIDPERKPEVLRCVLERFQYRSALVFANLKVTVSELSERLRAAGVSAAALHGDLEQPDRDRILAMFRNSSTKVLVATDVAARGLDVEQLDLVVNYDVPGQPEVYVHRIGRTGRAGRSGVAVTLGTAAELARLRALEGYDESALEEVEASELSDHPLASSAAHAASTATTASTASGAMATLRIGGGRKQKLRPGDILGALTGEAGGFSADQVGKIEIFDNFSFVAVAAVVSEEARLRLARGRIKGKRFSVFLVS